MKARVYGFPTLAAMIGLVVFPALALAGHLDAPENVTCVVEEDVILVDWDDVDGAVKYSVDVVAGYDTDGDGEIDEIVEWSFGTGDRTDDGEMGDSDLPIPLDDLVVCEEILDDEGNVIEEICFDAVAVMLRVKALDPGRGKGRQNHPFSEWCEVDLDGEDDLGDEGNEGD